MFTTMLSAFLSAVFAGCVHPQEAETQVECQVQDVP